MGTHAWLDARDAVDASLHQLNPAIQPTAGLVDDAWRMCHILAGDCDTEIMQRDRVEPGEPAAVTWYNCLVRNENNTHGQFDIGKAQTHFGYLIGIYPLPQDLSDLLEICANAWHAME